MIITTGDNEAHEPVKRAMALSLESGAKYVRRGRYSVAKLSARYGNDDVLVIMDGGARLFRSGGKDPLTFHPSMAFIRAKRILKGQSDIMLEIAGVKPGDIVVDCTAGLGSDASIFSLAVGPEGEVIALEDSLPLWALLREGFNTYVTQVQEFDDALRRVKLRCMNHLDALREMPDKSVDVVYFDPMFREPIVESSAISPLRNFANMNRLDIESIVEARRVARKSIVLKEKKGCGEFERLGFDTVVRPNTKIVYGVISLEN